MTRSTPSPSTGPLPVAPGELDLHLLLEGSHRDPHGVLGPHRRPDAPGTVVVASRDASGERNLPVARDPSVLPYTAIHRNLAHLDALKRLVIVDACQAEAIYDVWEVRQAVAELPADEQEVVRLQHLDGFTHTQIAERLMALPGTKDYGALAVLVQSVADVSLVRKLPPAVFWPRPQVDSAIVLVRPNAEKRAQVGDVQKFRYFLRDLYAHRRKNLRGGLVSMAGRGLEKKDVDAKLAELGIDGTVRAETLDVAQHLRLCAAFG